MACGAQLDIGAVQREHGVGAAAAKTVLFPLRDNVAGNVGARLMAITSALEGLSGEPKSWFSKSDKSIPLVYL